MAGKIQPRRYYSIGEVAKLINVEPHVLRFWEKEFKTYIKPIRISGRRFYSSEQIRIFQRIKYLLYHEQYTIPGAKKKISMDHPSFWEEIKQELKEIYELLR